MYSLHMKMIKGSGQIRKLCYCCHEDEEHSRYILPAGLLLTGIVNGKLMQIIGILYTVFQFSTVHEVVCMWLLENLAISKTNLWTSMSSNLWYRDGAGNTAEENSSVFSLIRMR